MRPPLGHYPRETRHLNLQWSIGDIERLDFIRKHRSLSLEEVDMALARRGLACPVEHIVKICREKGYPAPQSRARA